LQLFFDLFLIIGRKESPENVALLDFLVHGSQEEETKQQLSGTSSRSSFQSFLQQRNIINNPERNAVNESKHDLAQEEETKRKERDKWITKTEFPSIDAFIQWRVDLIQRVKAHFPTIYG
jgi:hypothetical protein